MVEHLVWLSAEGLLTDAGVVIDVVYAALVHVDEIIRHRCRGGSHQLQAGCKEKERGY